MINDLKEKKLNGVIVIILIKFCLEKQIQLANNFIKIYLILTYKKKKKEIMRINIIFIEKKKSLDIVKNLLD